MLSLLVKPPFKSHIQNAVSSQPIFETVPTWGHVCKDMSLAGNSTQKLRVWDSVGGQIENSITRYDQFTARFFDQNPTRRPLTCLGVKVTDKGVLECKPNVPSVQIGDRTLKFTFETRKRIPKSNRKESRTQSSIDRQDQKLDYELVISEPTAITGYHIDSFVSGSWHFEISGIKIIFSSPVTDRNWKLFENCHLNTAPLDK